MQLTDDFLKELLVDSKIISKEDFERALEYKSEKGISLLDSFLETGIITDEQLGSLIADRLGFPFTNLRKENIEKEVLEIIPSVVAKSKMAIVFSRTKTGLKLALNDPRDLEFKEFIERKTGEKITVYYATESDIQEALKYYRKDLKTELEEIAQTPLAELKPEGSNLEVSRIIELIIRAGYDNRASDIHFEPYRSKTVIRFRIDGILHDVLELPFSFHESLVSRIKIISNLRTDIHEASQDGRFSFNLEKEKADIRVSVVPIEEGEKVVLRLLSEKARRLDLEELGIDYRQLKILREAAKKPWGMILVSGPTGSGKTTTLYGLIKTLNSRRVNIMTIEDPVEYDIEGINQIQVNPQTNLTFAEGLRAVVRQNPDIIMVGEIRDQETASLAVNAAMTGHLVFSTFHANDSATSLPRLMDMNIEPFLVASTINLIVSQRLLRRICPRCIESYEVPLSELKELPLNIKNVKKVRFFRGKGCGLCQNTGYLGRTGVFELMEIKEPIKRLIMGRANAFQIREEAQKLGMKTMLEDGLEKAEKGITTLDEVLRVTRE